MFLIFLPIMFLLVSPNLWEPVYLSRSIFLGLWVVLYLGLVASKNKKIRLDIFDLIMGGIILGYILSAFANSQNPIHAFLGYDGRHMGIMTLISILVILIYVKNSSLTIDQFIRIVVWPLVLFSIVYGYIQKFGQDPLVWGEMDRTVLTLGNSDFAAQLLAGLLVLPLYYIFTKKSKTIKLFSVFCLLLIIDLGLFTQAFQFRVVGLFTITAYILLVYYPEIRKLGIFKIVGSTTLIIFISIFYTVQSWEKLDLISRTGATDRIDSVISGLKIFQSHPLFGVGIEQAWRFDPYFRLQRQALRNGPSVISDKAHNIFVDHFANGGLFVGLLFVLFVLASTTIILKQLSKTTIIQERQKIALVSVIWLSYVIEMFITTDNVFIMAFSYTALALALKVQKNYEVDKIGQNALTKRTLFIKDKVVIIPLLVALISNSYVGIKAISNSYLLREIDLGNIRDGDRIVKIVKDFPNQKGAEAISASLLRNTQNCPLVNPISQELLRINPRSSQAMYFLAICSDANMNQKEALGYVKRAVALQPLNNVYLEAQLRLQVSLDLIEEASETYKKMMEFDPNYVNLPALLTLLNSSR